MADYWPIQQSFNFGEISPLLGAQVESDLYRNGTRYLFNMMPNSHGPAVRRDGFEFISIIDEQIIPLKMIPFNASLEKDYVVVIGHQWVQIYDDSGPAFGDLGALDLITNGNFNAGVGGWLENSNNPASIMSWNSSRARMVLTSGGGGAGQSVGGSQLVNLPNSTGVQYRLEYAMIETLPGTSTYEIRIGTTFGDDDVLNHVIVPGLDQEVLFTPAAAILDIWVEFHVTEGGSQLEIDEVALHEDGAPTVLLQFPSPYTAAARIENIQWAMAPGGNPALYLAHPTVEPHSLVLTISTNEWDFFPIPFTNPIPEWQDGNWPRAITFFGQRSWWGGVTSSPEKFWGSTVGGYIDFDFGSSQADEAIVYEIARRGDILFMSGAKELIIGSENSEYLVISEGPVLKPGDIEVKQQSSYGSFFGTYEQSGDRILYVSATGTKLRTMAYEWTKDAWVSVDMAWPSEHLTRGVVTQMAYQFDPQQVIWMITAADQLISCSYDREQGIIGWAQHGRNVLAIPGDELPGFSEGVIPGPFNGEAATWGGIAVSTVFGVNRLWAAIEYIDGTETRRIALVRLDNKSTMDGFVKFVSATPTNIVTGLGHLEGLEVGVLVDDAVDPLNTVVGGQIETQHEGLIFHVGLTNTAYLKTLPKEGGNQAGSAQGAKKRDPYIFVRVNRSSRPFINGKRPSDRTPSTPMDTAEPLRSEDIRITDLGWDRTAQIEIWENLPLPLTVIGIFGKNATKAR